MWRYVTGGRPFDLDRKHGILGLTSTSSGLISSNATDKKKHIDSDTTHVPKFQTLLKGFMELTQNGSKHVNVFLGRDGSGFAISEYFLASFEELLHRRDHSFLAPPLDLLP